MQGRSGNASWTTSFGHLHAVMELFKAHEGRDPAEILGDGQLPGPIVFKSHRETLREVIDRETSMRKNGTQFVDERAEGESSRFYRAQMNADGSPSELVSARYCWTPGTELARAGALRAR